MKGGEWGNAMDKLNLEKSQTRVIRDQTHTRILGWKEPVEEDLLWTLGRGSACE